MAEPTPAFVVPFSTKIRFETGRPEEVPLQKIVCQTPQSFTREEFDQARKHLENANDGEVKEFKYLYPVCPEQKNTQEMENKLPIIQEKVGQKEPMPAVASPQKHAICTEERSPIKQNVEPQKPPKKQKSTTLYKEDLIDVDYSILLRYYAN